MADPIVKTVVLSRQARVRVMINDPDVIERVTGPDGDEWRAQCYDLHTEEEVLGHLAYNCLNNGRLGATQLDGWADLPGDAVTMAVEEYSGYTVEEVF